MRIVTTADDFGFDDETVDCTIACLEDGVLTGASIMANMPATRRALDYARHRPDKSYGVHLVFCTDENERPCASPDLIPDLVTADGKFLASNRMRLLGLTGQLPVEQIVREAEAQIGAVRDCGILIDYVDSHGHLHKTRPFQLALQQVLPKFGIRHVRSAQNIYFNSIAMRPMGWLTPLFNIAIRNRFDTTRWFFMPETSGDRTWPQRLLERIASYDIAGDIEVGVHPGRYGWRQMEDAQLRSFVAEARVSGHHLVAWRNVKGLRSRIQ